MSETSKKWSVATIATLMLAVGDTRPVSVETVNKAAEELQMTTRSVASKLRNLDIEVASMATSKAPSFTQEEGDALSAFVTANAGTMTYKDISENFMAGQFSAKQVQGKILALELTGSVKQTEKAVAVRKYSEAEEAKFISMAEAGSFIEDIAFELDRPVQSIRGKALSLTRSGQISAIPTQKESHAKESTDAIDALGADIATMTVAEIALATGKTERGLKTSLTRRGIDVADYKGAAKKEKNLAKAYF